MSGDSIGEYRRGLRESRRRREASGEESDAFENAYIKLDQATKASGRRTVESSAGIRCSVEPDGLQSCTGY